ncbi:hypothetical protein [Gluconobacter oxydans]|uniref:hypothetical protein n=1 Tax=Gluconobacter oxydans TaxID=442 RepID=UPI001CD8D606|nr:hypothetical protein [Gluconobacter oxydans]
MSPTPPVPPNTTAASEYDRLLAAVTSENHPDDVWFVRWAIEQVTRLGEAASLRWRDINLVARRHTKTMHLVQAALTKDLCALPESCFTLCLWDKGQREQAWPETI